MSRRDIVNITTLSLIWGASFMFIRVADRQFDPWTLVWLRVLLGCVVLVPVALSAGGRGALRQARTAWKRLFVLGAVNTAAPFMLFAWAETRIDSSLAGILQAAAPIFTLLLGARFAHERVGGAKLGGVLLGLAGVAVLVGVPGGGSLLAQLAVILAAFCYACGATFSSLKLRGTDPLVMGAGSCLFAMLLTAPLGIAHFPTEAPGWKEIASVAVLGLVGTGVAYMILFALLRSAGPSRAILVTYTIPAVAVLYGTLLLDEPLRGVSVVGLALILAGVGLAGRSRKAKRQQVQPAPVAVPE
ncbi:MAG TPA: DMT family transporter [Gaiellaceae bacterium]|jgi:drug/metabolite transporter (DMT)-like permease|nr:DMT family transporter [Gaiellaceae bacterium]